MLPKSFFNSVRKAPGVQKENMKQIIISTRALGLIEHIVSEFGHYFEHDDEVKDREEFYSAIRKAKLI